MNNVIAMPVRAVTFDVEVIHDAQAGQYVAVCDGLRLATEAPSFDALIARVWEIAPEMAQENGLHVAPEALRLRFSYVDGAPALLAM
jgi:uncharacterized protein (DUF1810 family)